MIFPSLFASEVGASPTSPSGACCSRFGSGLTVTVLLPVMPEAVFAAVAVTVPAAAAVNNPFSLIAAIPVPLVTDQIISLLSALAGITIAVNCNVPPMSILDTSPSAETLMALTGMGTCVPDPPPPPPPPPLLPEEGITTGASSSEGTRTSSTSGTAGTPIGASSSAMKMFKLPRITIMASALVRNLSGKNVFSG